MSKTMKWINIGLSLALLGAFVVSCDAQIDVATDPQTTTTTTTTPPVATYTLSLNAGSGGTATPANGGVYNSGTIVTLTASPASGNEVAAWSGTGNDSSTSTTNHVTMTADKTVGVTFMAIPPTTYTLSLSVSGSNGTVSASPSSGPYTSGTQVTLTAFPATNYQVGAWTGTDDDTNTTTTNTVTMGSNKTVTVSFVFTGVTYNLTWSTPDNWGSIQVSPAGTSTGLQSAKYPLNTVVTVSAITEAGFEFGCFVGTTEGTTNGGVNGISSTQVNHVTMSTDKTVKACFPETDGSDAFCTCS